MGNIWTDDEKTQQLKFRIQLVDYKREQMQENGGLSQEINSKMCL